MGGDVVHRWVSSGPVFIPRSSLISIASIRSIERFAVLTAKNVRFDLENLFQVNHWVLFRQVLVIVVAIEEGGEA